MRVHIPVQVRWADLDAYGHVNNAAVLTLLEEARVHALWGGGEAAEHDAESAAVFTGGADADTFTLIARQEIEYLLPIPHLREPLDIELWVGRLGGASIDVCYEIHSPEGASPRVLYTRATTVIVLVDSSGSKPRRITDIERERLSAFIEDPIAHRR